MQDSSTNPYIPQQNEQLRAATEPLSSPLKRTVKLLMIITAVLAVLIAVGLAFVIPRTSAVDNDARVDLGHALQPPAQLSKLVPVSSDLGFSLKYDNQLFVSYAETVPPVDQSGKTGSSAYFENDDLRTTRDYNLVRITPAESSDSDRSAVADPPQFVVSSAITADDIKATESKTDYKGLSQLAAFVKLDTDKRLAAKMADDGTTVSIDATKPSSQTINGTKYQKVRFTTKNENYRIVNEKYDDCYYTIQNDTPIAACITNVRPNSRDDAALDESVFQTLSYHKPKETVADTDQSTDSSGKTTTTTNGTSAAQKTTPATDDDTTQAPLETPKPSYLSDATTLATIAKAQPSIVRIGALYCADLNLKVASGEVITTLTDACVGRLSSGTVVSKDGYIATTGHAIRYDPKAAINGYINFADSQKDLLDRLDRVLDYLLKARLILDSDADYLRTGAQIGDQEALAKIENIGSVIPDNYVTPTKDSYSYAIQPTDKPLVVDASTGARPTFAYSDSVISAKFVAATYDTDKSAQENFDSPTPSKDVGLLKADGSFQNVPVGQGSTAKANDQLTIMGYPTFSDSSLVIGKNQNAPVVTTAKVNQTYDKDGQKLIQTDTPVIPGTDGGGTFGANGTLLGFGVYGLSYCPDQQCFSTGTVRPSNELMTLLDDKNMSLGGLSEASQVWSSGVDDYLKADYASAAAAFGKAGSLYGYNTFAAPLQKLAASKQGSAHDTSLMNQLVGIMIGTLVVMVLITIVSAVLFVLQKRRLDSLRVGHYGAAPAPAPQSFAAPQPAAPSYPQQPPVMPSQAPVQSFGQQPPVQPSVPLASQTPPAYPPQAPAASTPPPVAQSSWQAPAVSGQSLPPAQQPTPQAPQPTSDQSGSDPFYRQ